MLWVLGAVYRAGPGVVQSQMTFKQDIICSVYYIYIYVCIIFFRESRFGSKQRTFKDAKETEKAIAMKDVEESPRNHVEQKNI